MLFCYEKAKFKIKKCDEKAKFKELISNEKAAKGHMKSLYYSCHLHD